MKEIILLTFLLFTGCNKLSWWHNNYPSDNFIEEIIEDRIEEETGYEIDLSPFSDEAVGNNNLQINIFRWEFVNKDYV